MIVITVIIFLVWAHGYRLGGKIHLHLWVLLSFGVLFAFTSLAFLGCRNYRVHFEVVFIGIIYVLYLVHDFRLKIFDDYGQSVENFASNVTIFNQIEKEYYKLLASTNYNHSIYNCTRKDNFIDSQFKKFVEATSLIDADEGCVIDTFLLL